MQLHKPGDMVAVSTTYYITYNGKTARIRAESRNGFAIVQFANGSIAWIHDEELSLISRKKKQHHEFLC